MVDNGRAVVAFIGNDGFRLAVTQQGGRFPEIASLSAGETEGHRQSAFGQQVDFGPQTSSGTP